MTQIDWSKAPEGATHFLPEQPSRGWVACWYKNIGGIWFARNKNDCDWYPDNDYQEVFIPLLIERQPEWTGEGLPPVGLDVQRKSCGVWIASKALAHSPCGRFCAYADAGGMNWGGETLFRPIRTPAQLAAEEREKAIEDICNTSGDKVTPRSAGLLYDAGYRKIEVQP